MPEPFLPALVAVIERYETEVADESDDLRLLKEQVARGDALKRRDTWPGHLTTSAIMLDPDQRQVLLISHRRLQRWLQPGGHYERAPFFWQSAEREGVEETGLPTIARHRWHGGTDLPVDIDSHVIPASPLRGEPEHTHHDMRYLFTASPEGMLVPQWAEVAGAEWRPLAELQAICPRVFRRLRVPRTA